ncbi:hypothetical protein B0H16DRAFT_734006 [Mycena metata]|uniref:Uncharacterized protein n=1 Tax=Mycena metata TaxID=1033252 RepID=A0AAD7DZH3_9AGAR|nr:hypothetical protein B0H16DRAFT_734006 [Mycena metata]
MCTRRFFLRFAFISFLSLLLSSLLLVYPLAAHAVIRVRVGAKTRTSLFIVVVTAPLWWTGDNAPFSYFFGTIFLMRPGSLGAERLRVRVGSRLGARAHLEWTSACLLSSPTFAAAWGHRECCHTGVRMVLARFRLSGSVRRWAISPQGVVVLVVDSIRAGGVDGGALDQDGQYAHARTARRCSCFCACCCEGVAPWAFEAEIVWNRGGIILS